MKTVNLVLFILLVMGNIQAQTRRMTNPQQARTYTLQNQGRTTVPLLQEAQRQFQFLDHEETYFALDKAVAQNPYAPEALVLRAKFKKMVGMQSEAERDFELAHRLNPYAANLYGYHGSEGLLKVLSIEPERSIKSLSTFQKLNYYYQAIDKKSTAERIDNEELDLLEQLVVLIEEDRLLPAMTLSEQLIENYPSALAYDLQGLVFQKQDNFPQAIKAYSTAIELDPEFAIAWYNLGQIERKLGNIEKAKTYLDQAISLQATLSKAYFERALILKMMGDKTGAIEDYETVIEMNGETYMKAFVNRGLTKKMLGDFNGALNDLNLAIDQFPNDAALRNNRGNLYLLFNLPRNALDDYTKAIHLDRNYAEAYYNRALAHLLVFDKISGCADLSESLNLGYEKAKDLQKYFCME